VYSLPPDLFTAPLPGDAGGGGIRIQTDWWERFMEYTVEIGSGFVICMESFVKISAGIEKFGGGGVLTYSKVISKASFIFFKIG
jgi:hypothetical protein